MREYSHVPSVARSVAMPDMFHEQRRAPRVPCDLRVLVIVPPAVFGPGVLLNVSLGGALLQTPLILNPLAQIELEVEAPGMRRSSIKASITRCEVNQYGVEFRGVTKQVIDKMLQLAQSQSEMMSQASSSLA